MCKKLILVIVFLLGLEAGAASTQPAPTSTVDLAGLSQSRKRRRSGGREHFAVRMHLPCSCLTEIAIGAGK
jgi:hypothetical protein